MVYLRRSDPKKRRAFTIGEIMAVIVIIGVIAAFAFPNLLYFVLRIRNQESINFLYTLYPEQLQHNREFGNYAADLSEIDVYFPNMSSTHFDNLTASNDLFTTCGLKRIGFVNRMGPAGQEYIIQIMEDGSINCRSLASPTICGQMGLSESCNH